MTTFTKEQLISHVSENVKAMKFAVKQTAFKNSLEAIELDLALALVAQASLEAEPVLYMNRFTGKTFSLEEQPGADKEPEIYVPLYAAPPDSAAMLQAGNFRENKDSSTNNFRETSETSTNSPVIPDGLSTVCAEAYQVVGVMADALGVFGDAAVQKVLDNLSQQKLVHRDVLPFSLPVTPDGWISCSERMPPQDDWILIYSKHGEYMAGQVQGEYVELSDGTLSWLGNALYWMLLPEPPQEAK